MTIPQKLAREIAEEFCYYTENKTSSIVADDVKQAATKVLNDYFETKEWLKDNVHGHEEKPMRWHPLTKKIFGDYAELNNDKLIREWLESKAKEFNSVTENSLFIKTYTPELARQILELSEPEPNKVGTSGQVLHLTKGWIDPPKKPELPAKFTDEQIRWCKDPLLCLAYNELIDFLKARE